MVFPARRRVSHQDTGDLDSMDSVTELMQQRAGSFSVDLNELLTKHSSLRFWNHRGGEVLIVAGDYLWNPLDEAGRRLQSKIATAYERYDETMRILLKNTEYETDFANLCGAIEKAIEQRGDSYEGDPQKILASAATALDEQLALLRNLYDSAEGQQ